MDSSYVVNEQKISVSYRNINMILIFRQMSPEEYIQSFHALNSIRVSDKPTIPVWQEALNHIDNVLVGIEGMAADGKPARIEFRDSQTGVLKPLTSEVPNWKKEVPFMCKLAAMGKYMTLAAKVEDNQLKN